MLLITNAFNDICTCRLELIACLRGGNKAITPSLRVLFLIGSRYLLLGKSEIFNKKINYFKTLLWDRSTGLLFFASTPKKKKAFSDTPLATALVMSIISKPCYLNN